MLLKAICFSISITFFMSSSSCVKETNKNPDMKFPQKTFPTEKKQKKVLPIKKNQEKAFSFLALGDGGKEGKPLNWVSHHLKQKCSGSNPCHFLTVAGDNFYDTGLHDTKSSPGSQFDKYFVKRFQKQLPQKTFYAVLGNHDVGINWDVENCLDYEKNDQGKNQVLMHGKKNWYMPSYEFYQVSFNIKGDVLGTKDYSPGALSTPVLNSFIDLFGLNTELYACSTDWPKVKASLIKSLKNAKGSWKVMIGHRPIFSPGEHGNKREVKIMKELFDDVLCPYVDLYIAGHDHIQALMEGTCKKEKRKIPLLITGAASKVHYSQKNPEIPGLWKLHYADFGALGYTRISLGENEASFEIISENDSKTFSLPKPTL